MTFTGSEWSALAHLAKHGAVTLGRMRLEVGPTVNWRGVVDRGLVWVYRGTPYGDVLGLTGRGRTLLMQHFDNVPYLASPGSVVDRAFGLEAVRILEAKGYTEKAREYKIQKLRGGPEASALIKRFHMRVPEEMMRELLALPFQGRAYGDGPALGYPFLYASISRGGATPARAKALIQEHASHTKEWLHPLMIAVLKETQELREVVRRSNHQAATTREKYRTKPSVSPYMNHDRVQLVTVPLA